MAVRMSDFATFRLLGEVRWQVFRNSLRAGFKRVEVLIRALTWIGGISIVAVVALLFGLDGYFLFVKRPLVTHILLWVLALIWQIIPLVLEGSIPALDFQELARYPIRFRLFYLMSVTYGLLDPAALMCVTWLVSLGVGIILRNPSSTAPVIVFFILFALLNLLLNRLVFGWLRRVTATRRNREILVVGGVLLMLALQLSFWTWMPRLESAEGKKRLLPTINAIHHYSPMGMTMTAVTSPREHGLEALGLLGGACGLLGLLLYRQLRPMYLGEMQSDSAVRSGSIQVEPGWQLPFAGPQFSAIVEREVRYFFRESRLWVNQVSIWTFVLVGSLAPTFFQRAFGWGEQRRGELLYPIAISYSMIVMATLAYNCFWSDSGGYYRWLLSPVSMRQVLQAKNLFFGMAALVNLVVVTAIVSIGIAVPPIKVLNGILTTGFIALGVLTAGNMLSGWFPKKIKSGSFNTKNASEAATIIGLIVLVALSAACFGANWAGKRWEQPWLTPVVLMLLIVVAARAYWVSLRLASEYLEKHQDKMCDELM